MPGNAAIADQESGPSKRSNPATDKICLHFETHLVEELHTGRKMPREEGRCGRQLCQDILSKADELAVDLPQHLLNPGMPDSPIVVRMWQSVSGEDREARNK